MYICGLILFYTIFIYDFSRFDFLGLYDFFFGFVLLCVLDEKDGRSKFMCVCVCVCVFIFNSVFFWVEIDKLIFKILS